MDKHNKFLEAINKMKKVKVVVNSFEKGRIERTCVPFDYGPSRKFKDGGNRYHLYDLDSPDGSHNLSILPNQLVSVEIMADVFNPADYVKWTPRWFFPRNWGSFS